MGSLAAGQTVGLSFGAAVTQTASPGSQLTDQLTLTAPGERVRRAATLGVVVDYFVDVNNGSDVTGDGSANAPWKTITRALSQAAANGSVIRVAPGLYNQAAGESFPLNMTPGVSLMVAGHPSTLISGVRYNSVVNFPNTR